MKPSPQGLGSCGLQGLQEGVLAVVMLQLAGDADITCRKVGRLNGHGTAAATWTHVQPGRSNCPNP